MATKIITKNSSTATSIPTAGDLVQGELAVNVTDKRLFTEDSGGAIVELGTNPSTLTSGAATFSGAVSLNGAAQSDSITNTLYMQNLAGTRAANIQLDASGGVSIFDYNGSAWNKSLTLEGGAATFSGTVTADGLTVESATGAEVTLKNTDSDGASGEYVGKLHFEGSDSSSGASGVRAGIYAQYGSSFGYTSLDFLTSISGGALKKGMNISGEGDISFYEDTGSSPKFFWDSSAESLGIGTSLPTEKLDISQSVNNSVIAKVTNTNSGDLASSRVEIYNDNSSFGQLTTYSSGFAYNVLGSNAANWTFLGTSGSNSNGLKIGTLTADPVVFGTSDLERMRIDASGNVGIGMDSPNYSLTSYKAGANANYLQVVNGSSGPNAANGILYGLDGAGNGVINKQGAGDLITSVAGSEAMRIAANGNLLVGTTSFGSNVGVQARGSSGGATDEPLATSVGGTGSIVQIGFFNPNGRVGYVATSGTSTSYSTSSDQRLKDNIVDAPSASDDIDAIQVRSFDWKADGSHQKYGMVAQELQGVAPEAVTGDADSDEMMGVDYSKLVPMLVKEIQSLRSRVHQLENS